MFHQIIEEDQQVHIIYSELIENCVLGKKKRRSMVNKMKHKGRTKRTSFPK